MLKIIKSVSQLNIPQFLSVYAQSTQGDPYKENDFVAYLQEDFFCQKDAFYAIWVVDELYRSALRLESYREGLLLQAVETKPDDRRKGFSYALLTCVLEHLRVSGYTGVYSHVAKNNRASLALHRKCGFVQISESARFIDGTVTQNSCTMYIDLKKSPVQE